jgi:hypothetical protein
MQILTSFGMTIHRGPDLGPSKEAQARRLCHTRMGIHAVQIHIGLSAVSAVKPVSH